MIKVAILSKHGIIYVYTESATFFHRLFVLVRNDPRYHVMRGSVIIIRRTFFEVIECVFYIQPIGISEKNYKVMT